MAKFITLDNLSAYSTDLASKIKAALAEKAGLDTATSSADGLMSAEDKANLDSLQAASGNYIPLSQKGAASGVAELDESGLVPSSQLPSYVDDVLEYSAKSSFPTTGETGKIYVDTSANLTYRWSGSTYVEISASLALGTTSSTAYRGDYGNVAYTHASDSSKSTSKTAALVKVGATAYGHVIIGAAVTKSDITALGIPSSDTTYSEATTSAAGLMSASDKTKLDAIASGATKVTVDSALSSTSSNPVQNKVINTALAAKQDTLTAGANITISSGTISATDTTYIAATTSAAGLMSAADKTKLDGIATGATKVTVDSALSSSSTNPVQNKVIYSALAGKQATLSSDDATFSSGVMSINEATDSEVQALVTAMSF